MYRIGVMATFSLCSQEVVSSNLTITAMFWVFSFLLEMVQHSLILITDVSICVFDYIAMCIVSILPTIQKQFRDAMPTVFNAH